MLIFYSGVVHHPSCQASSHVLFIFRRFIVRHIHLFSFGGFSYVFPYGPLYIQARLVHWVMSWWRLSLSLSPISSLHWLVVMPSSGFSFWCHASSQFIIRFHCGGFNRVSLVAHLLVTYLASPVLIGRLFSSASLVHLLLSVLLWAYYFPVYLGVLVNLSVLSSWFVQGGFLVPHF